jgi:hypothetical protein
MLEAVKNVLDAFPNNDILEAIDDLKSTGTRPAPLMVSYLTIREIREARKELARLCANIRLILGEENI